MINDTICHSRHFLTTAEISDSSHINEKKQEPLMALLVKIFSPQQVMPATRAALFTSYAMHSFTM